MESWLTVILSQWDKLSCRDGPSWLSEGEEYTGLHCSHTQLILLINTLEQRAATNQRNHMLPWMFKQAHPRPSVSHDPHSVERATLKHAAMQSRGRVCVCAHPLIHSELALTATSSCRSAAPSSTPVDADKVAAALLSQRLKFIYKFCQAVISLTLLPLAEVKSC